MIHVPGKLIFIHIPRTGGTSIRTALKAAFPNAIEDMSHKHCTAWALFWTMPIAEWESCLRFTVVRDPHDLIESDWRYWRHVANTVSPAMMGFDTMGREKARRVAGGDFHRFVREEWLGMYSPLLAGGFRRTYCYGPSGENLGVEVLRFDRLPIEWAALCERLGIATTIPRLNSAPRPPVVWDEADRLAVRELCWMDV